MNHGFVKFWRKTLGSAVMSNVKVWYLWSWLLMRASYKHDQAILESSVEELQPGQLIFGRHAAAKRMALSEQEIRTCIEKLKMLGCIEVRTTKRYSVITICNWGRYQVREEQGQPDINPISTTSKEVKKVKSVRLKVYECQLVTEITFSL